MSVVQVLASEHDPHYPTDLLPTRNKALIIEDNEVDRRRLKSYCDRTGLNLEFTDAVSLAEMRVALDADQFDIIFIDYRLTDGDGLKALDLVKRHPTNCFAATIMVAGIAQTSVAVTALKSGCSDYLIKDTLDPAWLRRAVTNALEKSALRRDVDSSEQIRQTLQTALNGFTQEFVQDMKPLLPKMMRQIRAMRAKSEANNNYMASAELTELEVTCARLWEFSENVEGACDRYM